MSSIGSFGAFTQARLGIYAAQYGLTVTGNNISNISTSGYTRQVLDQVSLRTGGSDRYQSKYGIQVGNGALCTGVSQIRDPYLDIRYRSAASEVGYQDTMLAGMKEIAAILDEVADGEDKNGLLHAQLSEFATALRNLGLNAGQEDFDTIVRGKAEDICTLFNNYAQRLETLRLNKQDGLKTDINTVNDLLTGIRSLNASIRKSEIHGDNALEMKDERNRLIDQLSEMVKINVTYSMEDVGAGQQVEKLTITLDNANPDVNDQKNTDKAYLVDGVYCTQLNLVTTPKLNPDYDPNDATSMQYLDKYGKPTNDAAAAEQVPDEHYTMTLSKMVDSKGREWSSYKSSKQEISKADYDAAIQNGTSKTEQVQVNGTDTTIKTDYVTANGKYYAITTTTQAATEVTLDDNDLRGSIQASRELLTEEGEFASTADIAVDESATVKRGIPYYQKSLDLLAQKFAEEFNKLNVNYRADADGYYMGGGGQCGVAGTNPADCDLTKAHIPADPNKQLELAQANGFENIDEYVKNKHGYDTLDEFLAEHGVVVGLFSNSNDSDDMTGITASNINVSHSWSIGAARVITSTKTAEKEEGVDQSTQSDNINHMLALLEKDLVYNPQDWGRKESIGGNNQLQVDAPGDASGNSMFRGTFQEMLNNMASSLGKDQSHAQIQLNTSYSSAIELDTNRDSVSGVDLNDEAMNMMQYQKAYSAACRLMTVLDEVLDKLVNGT